MEFAFTYADPVIVEKLVVFRVLYVFTINPYRVLSTHIAQGYDCAFVMHLGVISRNKRIMKHDPAVR